MPEDPTEAQSVSATPEVIGEEVEEEEGEESTEEEQKENEAADDKQKDMLWVLTKPIDEMTLEEQLDAIQRIRELRKVRIAATKRKTELDIILQQLDPARASSLLKQLDALLNPTNKE